MKLILLQNINKLGKKGDIVDVSDGYARNHLVPQKKAVPATKASQAKVVAKQEKVVRQQSREQHILAEIGNKHFQVAKKASETGHLFSSVSSEELARAIEQKLNINISRKDLKLSSQIKSLGSHRAEVVLFGKKIVVNVDVIEIK